MGTANNNRLPEEVYVRRRVAAVIVLLVVVALIVWGLVSLSGGAAEEDPDQAAATSTQAAETPAEETEPSESAETSETKSSETSETETTESESESADPTESTESTAASTEDAKQSCALSDLQITVTSDQPTYDSNTEPTFYMSVRNPTAVDCEVDLGENAMRFEVYDLASNARIWSDVDCNAPVGSGEETFEAVGYCSQFPRLPAYSEPAGAVGTMRVCLVGNIGYRCYSTPRVITVSVVESESR